MGLPKKEYMEHALRIWEEEGLPALKLKTPWYGYKLGHWREEDEEAAMLVASGEYQELWGKLNQKRMPMKGMLES